MNNKILISLGIIIVVGILIGSFIIGSGRLNGNALKDSDIKQTYPELEKYRSENIPEDCRMPEYESNIEQWKEHLGHHQNTLYCLEYYK